MPDSKLDTLTRLDRLEWENRRWRMVKADETWLIPILMLALVVFLVSPISVSAQAEYNAAIDRLMARVFADPQLKDALLARLRAKCSKRRCKDEDMRTGFELARSGIPRLDGATLVARARLLSVVLKSVDEKSCAAISRGSSDSTKLIAAMERLGPSFLDSWMDISSKALIAELRQVPPRKLTDQELRQAEAELRAHLTKQERERLAAMSEDQRGASDADVCWSVRLIYEKLPVLSEPHRGVMAVRLVQPE